jgi:predicted alpha/beta-hydrolase family hydrolase
VEPGTLAALKSSGKASGRSLPAGRTSVVLDPPNPGVKPVKPGTVVLLAHGAGGHRDHPHLLDLAALLKGLGLTVARYNFPYREKGGKAPPDKLPVLMETVRAAAAAVREALKPKRLILAGHSMGGRASSWVASEGEPCDGLLLFSYPWHPPGQSDKPRTEPLDAIKIPVLAFTGSRDTFCDREALAPVLRKLAKKWSLHFLEGADHGLAVAKKSGRTREEVFAEMDQALRSWLSGPA